MKVLAETTETLVEMPEPIVFSGAASEDVLVRDDSVAPDWRAKWQKVIDCKLIEWGRNPMQLEECEMIPPTWEAIERAISKALEAAKDNWTPPDRVVPDGDGGIVFERWDGPVTESLEISGDGSVDYVRCIDRQVVERYRLA